MNNGLIKKIDDLGRIVIPKDIRKRLSIKTDDALEVGIDGCDIKISKSIAIKEYKEFVSKFLEKLTMSVNIKVLATDREKIIFNNSILELNNVSELVSLSLLELIDRKGSICDECDIRPVIIDSNCEGIIIVMNTSCNELAGQIINCIITNKLDISC